MRYTVTALTENQEGIECIRSSLDRHGIDLRAVTISGPRPGGRRAADEFAITVAVATDDPDEVQVIKDALVAGAGTDIAIAEIAGAPAR